MKTIIDGKLYNTETAELIGGFHKGGTSNSDFNYMEQYIYKTKNGQLFLYIEGGAKTEFAIHSGNNTYGSMQIKLINEDDILKWIEKYDSWIKEELMDKLLEIVTYQEG